MVAISIEAIKYCALANGGAAVALLAYLGNVSAKAPTARAPDLSCAMAWFLTGLFFAGALIASVYLTQLELYNESFSDRIPRKKARHKYPLWVAMMCFALSLGSFGFGAQSAVASWASAAVGQGVTGPSAPASASPTSAPSTTPGSVKVRPYTPQPQAHEASKIQVQ